jgi:hypothetical protein
LDKTLLIVSYTFPPAPGIGGRRWVKFAKYLKRNGWLIKVIAARQKFTVPSEWTHDTEALTEDVYFIGSHYPGILSKNPETFYEKFLYRVALAYVKVRCRGNYYDRSDLWHNAILKKASEVINRFSIQNMVCTVGPFHASYSLLKLRDQFPVLKMLVDYRDPWSNNRTSFGFTSISEKRLQKERLMEKQVLISYDIITSVSDEMGNYFASLLSQENFRKKYFTLSNGFDREDFRTVKEPAKDLPGAGRVKIVFAGTFYTRSSHVFIRLAEALVKAEAKYPMHKDSVTLIFAGGIIDEIQKYFTLYPHLFIYTGKKSLSETYEIVASADYCAIFLTDDMNYSFSTKFYEYVALNKRIMSFSRHRGSHSRFIESNEIGIGIDFDGMEEFATDLVTAPDKFLFAAPPSYSVSHFDVAALTARLENIILG